jgi:ubiquinol-cytochrome c reductase cytochrome b subunit
MNIKDIQLLYKIKDALGVGKIKTRVRKIINNNEIKLARYNIRNKKHLKEIILPLFDKYPMLTNKQFDYLRFRDALLNDIKFYDDLPKYTRSKEPALRIRFMQLWVKLSNSGNLLKFLIPNYIRKFISN